MKKMLKDVGVLALMAVGYVIALLVIVIGSPFWALSVVLDDSEHRGMRGNP